MYKEVWQEDEEKTKYKKMLYWDKILWETQTRNDKFKETKINVKSSTED